MELNVGDKVRLTGPEWDSYEEVQCGSVVPVSRVDGRAAWADAPYAGALLNYEGNPYQGYEIELVTNEPKERPIHTLDSVTEGIKELIGVLVSTGLDPDDAKSIILVNIQARL